MNTESKQAAEQLAGARAIEKSIAVWPDHRRHCDFMQTNQDPEVGAVKRPVGGSSRVERWRGGLGEPCVLPTLSVAGARVSHRAPFPPPAHRTGLAVFPHPALGQESHAHAHSKLRLFAPS